jgi:hypothetical protein
VLEEIAGYLELGEEEAQESSPPAPLLKERGDVAFSSRRGFWYGRCAAGGLGSPAPLGVGVRGRGLCSPPTVTTHKPALVRCFAMLF